MKKSNWLISAFTLLVVGLAGCAYQGGEQNPIERRLTWNSYINGDDLRQSCRPGAPDAYRFVYNGNYMEQVRSYDLVGDTLKYQVISPADFTNWFVRGGKDLLAPWRAKKETTVLRQTDRDLLARAVNSDGLLRNDEAEQELSSDRFYWLVTACLDGQVHFRAYAWPREKIENLAFSNLLERWDMTQIPYNPPREVVDPLGEFAKPEQQVRFNIRVGPDGIMYQ